MAASTSSIAIRTVGPTGQCGLKSPNSEAIGAVSNSQLHLNILEGPPLVANYDCGSIRARVDGPLLPDNARRNGGSDVRSK